ncbi:MAG: hypothetical protein K6L76_01885 [Agarilytica sp.]
MRGIAVPYIIDVEASGMGADSYPIEIGLALDAGQLYCSLISPPPCWTHWSGEAEKIHNISRNLIVTKGKCVRTVAAELNALLDGKFVFSDGWGVDEPWVNRLFHTAKTEKKFRIYDLQTILSEAQMDVWHEVKNSVVADLDITRHRASNDARIIQETFRKTMKIVQNVNAK